MGSDSAYVYLLAKIWRFLSRRAPSNFSRVLVKRLLTTRINRPALSLSRLTRFMKGKEGKIAVIVGSLLNDTRVEALPKGLRVCALRFSDKAAQRIKQAGGETLTFDQLALIAPKGQKTVLLRGKLHSREVCRHWGAPGVPGSHAKPKLGNRKANLRGRKHQRARGRRNSKAWKVSK